MSASKKVLNFYKPVGVTPFEQVQSIKSLENYSGKKIGFAGRLDPMAEGVMIYLVGDENKNAKAYQKLSKTYLSEFLFGVSTDTYDTLGIIQNKKASSQPSKSKVDNYVKGLLGVQVQSYPPFSYIKVQGKPLFKWAREGKLHKIKIPSKKITVHSIKVKGCRSVDTRYLKNYVQRRINKVNGDFRQEEITNSWDTFIKANKNQKFSIYKLEFKVSSGTYIRGLANKMGEDLNTYALALNIVRTRVGKYTVNNSQRI